MHLPPAGGNLSCPPGCNRATITTHNGIIPQPSPKLPCHNLRFHGLVLPSCTLLHLLPPVLHSSLRRLKKLSVFFTLQEWNEFAQCVSAVSHQSDFHGITKSDTFRIQFDLYCPCLTRLWHELDVRK